MTSVASAQEVIREHLKQSAETTLRTADACAPDIERAAIMIADAFKAGGKLLICGNGGSAADSQHMAAELVSRLTLDFERPGLPAIALTTDTSVLTAYANDFDFSGVFSRQVQALGRAGDVLVVSAPGAPPGTSFRPSMRPMRSDSEQSDSLPKSENWRESSRSPFASLLRRQRTSRKLTSPSNTPFVIW
jgi:hypothetical protein